MFNTVIREMQIKTTMKYHFILIRMAIIKTTNNKPWLSDSVGCSIIPYTKRLWV